MTSLHNDLPYLPPETTCESVAANCHQRWTIGAVLGSMFLTAINLLHAFLYATESLRFFYGNTGPCGTCEGETIIFTQTWGLLIFSACIFVSVASWRKSEPLHLLLITSAAIAVVAYVSYSIATKSTPLLAIYLRFT